MSHWQSPDASTPRLRAPKRQARLTMRRRLRSRIAALKPRLVAAPAPRARVPGLLVLVSCVCLLYSFGMADMFYVNQVVVEGQNLVAADEVSRAAGARNFNVFYLQFGEMERRVREVPGIRNATVQYEFPNTVRVSIAERTPLLAWENGRRTAWVDESGAVFTIGKTPGGLPIVHDSESKARERVDPRTVAGIRALFTALPSLRRIEYDDLRGLTFADGRGWKILFGAPEQINAKLAILESLGSYLVSQKVEPEYIDVRLPERAFYKPK